MGFRVSVFRGLGLRVQRFRVYGFGGSRVSGVYCCPAVGIPLIYSGSNEETGLRVWDLGCSS